MKRSRKPAWKGSKDNGVMVGKVVRGLAAFRKKTRTRYLPLTQIQKLVSKIARQAA